MVYNRLKGRLCDTNFFNTDTYSDVPSFAGDLFSFMTSGTQQFQSACDLITGGE